MSASEFRGNRSAPSSQAGPDRPAETTSTAQAAAVPRGAGKDIGRVRAKVAWGWVGVAEGAFPKGGASRKRYGTLARKLPTYLQVSGLGQTLAFLFSKGERNADKPEQMLFTQLTEHLRSRLRPAPTGDFMVAVLDLSPAAYRTATREALAVADWLKRFAEGRLESEES